MRLSLHMHHALATALFLLQWPAAGIALDPARSIDQYARDVYSTESGLPQSSVVAMVQTRDGYLWLGTYEGLARFDGVRITVFDKSNTPEMESNGIRALLEDRDGDLWVGTAAGLLRYRRGRFERFDAAAGLASPVILCLHQDWKGVLWVGTPQGLHSLEAGRFRRFSGQASLSSAYISSLADDDRGRLWVGTNRGLNLLERGRVQVFDTADGLPHDDVRCLTWDDSGGELWIGTSGGGLARLRDDRFTRYGIRDGLSSEDIRAVFRDRHGVVWIGTNQEPLNRLQDGRVTVLDRRQSGVLSTRVILEDREGSLWVGTRDGLLQLKDDKFILYNSRNGLPVDPVRAVFQDRRGDMWVGTVGGGLARLGASGWRTYGRGQGLLNDHVWSIAQGRDQTIWAGTYGGGLHRLRGERFESITQRDGLANDIVRALLIDRRDRLWIGTNGGGLDCLEGGRIVNYTIRDGLPGNYVYALGEDIRERLWVGTFNGGLAVRENGRFRSIPLPGTTPYGVWAIHPDRDGAVWVGTDHGGLLCVRDGRVLRFTSRDGLYSDQAFQILEDGSGRLWMNSNKGIFYVLKTELLEFAEGRRHRIASVSFGKAEGIKVTESSGPAQPAGCIDGRGRLWFPTIRGVAVFDPDRLRTNPVAPPVVIEQVQIDGHAYAADRPCTAPPGEGNIEIDYTAISFLLTDKVAFKYQLEGYDRDWVSAGARRSAFYTNLPPGSYVFRVIACNGDEVWNFRGAAFSFRLRPHFHQTAAFRWLLALAVLLLLAGGFWLALRRVRTRERKLAKLVEYHTAELRKVNELLEQTNRQLQHLARFDGLTELANHRTFYEAYNREWNVSARERRPLALIALDIDHFKPFNDSCGHQQGDECLRRVAGVIRGRVKRPADLAARTGGEEFSVLLPGTDGDGALVLAEEIRRGIEELAIAHPSSPVAAVVTVSVGVSTELQFAGAEPSRLIALADRALYKAKNEGRNRVCLLR